MPRRFHTLWAVALGLSTTAAGPATRPADALAAARQVERADLLHRLDGLPTLPSATAAEVATLDLVDGHVRIRTALPDTAGVSRLSVSDLPGLCTVTLPGSRRGPPAVTRTALAEPTSLLLEVWQFDRPGEFVTDTTVEVLPINVQLSRMAETLGGSRQVSYLERFADPRAEDPAGPVATLRVSDKRDDDDAGPPDLVVTADSFLALRRLHPHEMAAYVEPILRDLHADAALLQADPVLAYQVFAADVPPDAAVAATVAGLVARLDADDFRDRDAAAVSLRRLGPAAVAELVRVDRAKLSPEQVSRVDAVLAAGRVVPAADARRLCDDPDFLIDCLRVEGDPFVTRTALARLGRGVSFDDGLRGQGRRDAIAAVRRRLAGPATRP